MVFSYQCEFKIIKDYHLISIVGVFFGSNHSIYFVVNMEWTKNHSVSISSNKYRAKNQLSRLFETHSPWLICYHSLVSARCFVVEVELKYESKYKPLISIGNVNESNKKTHQMEQVPNRKGHSKIGERTLQKCWVFAEIVVFLLRLWRKNKKL